MSLYVIRRVPDGAYVSDPRTNGTGGSYSRDLAKARTYRSREEAARDLCPENERIEPADAALLQANLWRG